MEILDGLTVVPCLDVAGAFHFIADTWSCQCYQRRDRLALVEIRRLGLLPEIIERVVRFFDGAPDLMIPCA